MITIIDNYDSFTYNLVQMIQAAGAEVQVLRNDAISVATLLAQAPTGILLSPGPGRPEDAGLCVSLFQERPEIPVLGVCLGHQALAVAFGARVRRAARLMHGKTSPVRHQEGWLFQGLPSPFEATRYHSLDVDPETLPPELEPQAWSDDGCLMALGHRELPYWGVQFHPESILSRTGPALLGRFLEACGETARVPVPTLPTPSARVRPAAGRGRA